MRTLSLAIDVTELWVVYTYIQSRFYRSPEVIMGMNYHMAIDMWSLGCILAELYTGFPIFPGENEQEQLSCIMEVLGSPDKEFINRSSRKRLFFGKYILNDLSVSLTLSKITMVHPDLWLTPKVVADDLERKRLLKFCGVKTRTLLTSLRVALFGILSDV